jgi:hypothetical protein
MDERQRRLGENEILYREVNERVRELNEQFGADDTIEFVCECARLECTERVSMTKAEYEQVRADGARFAVVPGHEDLSIEHVLARHERFFTIKKDDGGPAALAREADPR